MHTVSNLNYLETIRTPDPTATWEPIPHADYFNMVQLAVSKQGYELHDTKMEFSHGVHPHDSNVQIDNANMFGYAKLIRPQAAATYDRELTTLLGWRNSHNQRTSIGLVLGANITVCSNMQFDGFHKITQVHRPGAADNMRLQIQALLGNGWIEEQEELRDERIQSYKDEHIGDAYFNRIAREAICDNHIIPSSKYAKLVHLWENYEPFPDRTLWRMYNCFTEVMKGTSAQAIARNTQRLHQLMPV